MTFIPEAILDHRVSKKPRKQITVVTRPDGTTQHQVKVKRIAHVRVKVLWKNGEVTWVQADAMRKQNPFIFLPYVLARKLQKHKHFAWTKDIIKDPDKIMTALKTSVKKKKEIKFKFGVQVPNNMGQARELDEINNDKQWDGAVQSELRSINGHSTFIVLEEDEPLPDGYTQIPYHFVFDVKFDGRRKARLVTEGHRAPEVDKEESYSGVVGIETIRVAFLLAALNNLDVCAADISVAFLHGKTREKCFVRAGPEFGKNRGKRMIIDRGLYGLASSSVRFDERLAATLRRMGFKPSKADFDLWMRDRGDHWEFVACYVDDLLVFSKDPMAIIEEIRKEYQLKGVGIPEYYLGGDVEMVEDQLTTKDVVGIDEAGNDENDKSLSI